MEKKNVFVSRTDKGWSVKSSGALRSAAYYATQAEAIEKGRSMAMRNKSELRIKGVNGKTREVISFKENASTTKNKTKK